IQRLNRSLEHLSADLYSDKLHFICELFQNIDDSFNHCAEVSEPTIAWIIAKEELVVLSNESGFTCNDILSLCDIGNSSKKDTMYIGSKGIGFKSVFQITDRPEIHSNNFHICFDYSKYGPLGFENIIIFLNNLRCCFVLNIESNLTNLIRKHVDCNKITVKTNSVETNWFYCTNRLYLNDTAKKNADISIAFRLPDQQVEIKNFHPPRELLYAFLPLNIYAFKFIVNAPFELTSSRESILRGSDLNLFNFLKSKCWFSSIIPYLPIPTDFIEQPFDVVHK
ncbi:hypothetical protein MXB_5695, partial [Myxobolus squamalis]